MHAIQRTALSVLALTHSTPRCAFHPRCCDTTDYYALRFDGVRRLYGDDAPARLRQACVVVVGLGGVGSWSVEALARSGIGSLVLIDLDEICISNTNRQLHALKDTVGRSKAKMLAERVADINPDCEVRVREQWLLADDALPLLAEEQDRAAARGQTLAVLDAVDGYLEKAAMVTAAHELGLHIIVAGAAGGKSDPTQVRIADLTQVTNDALLKRVRQQLRKVHGFPTGIPRNGRSKGHGSRGGAKPWGVPCVYSPEAASVFGGTDIGSVCDQFGTACFGVGTFGFAAAAHLTAAISRDEGVPKRPRLDSGKEIVLDTSATEEGAQEVEEAEAVSLVADAAPVPYDSHCHAAAEAEALLTVSEGGGEGSVCLVSIGEAVWAATTAASRSAGALQVPYALGVHPWNVHEQLEGWADRLRAALLAQPEAMVGECGLDRARLDTAWGVQLLAFRTQLRLAAELRRPLIVHSVRSDGAMLEELGAYELLPPVVVMHAFGGSSETAQALMRLGEGRGCTVYFGFSARAARLKRAPAVIAELPAERLLLESDEHTADGARAGVAEACALLATARGWSEDEASERTRANARAAFAFRCEA